MYSQNHWFTGVTTHFNISRKNQRIRHPKKRGKESTQGKVERIHRYWGSTQLSAFLSVPKYGGTIIRMVYKGTSKSLNFIPWYPHFSLPIMYTKMRAVQEDINMEDIKTG